MMRTTSFRLENVFYNPNTENKFKIAISNLLAFLLAAVFTITMLKVLTIAPQNIILFSIVGIIFVGVYVNLTIFLFKRIFKK